MKSSLLVLCILFSGIAYATIISVSCSYHTIQTAIDSSTDSDTVLVEPGTYYENINFNGHNITLGSLFHTTGDKSYITQTVICSDQFEETILLGETIDSTTVITGFTITSNYGDYVIKCDGASPKLDNLVITNEYDLEQISGFSFSGIRLSNSSSVITDCKIVNNESYASDYNYIIGGGLYCRNSDLILRNVEITNNLVESYGGGIRTINSNLDLINTTIADNSCIRTNNITGGGIYCVNGSNPSINNMIMQDNQSSESGGAVYCEYSYPILENCIIEKCTSDGNGGALHINNSNISIASVIIDSSFAVNYGGGIFIDESVCNFNNLTVNYCSVDNDGGAIYLDNSELIIDSLNITNNFAGDNGGGIYSYYGSYLELSNSIFANNQSEANGGAIYSYDSECRLVSSLVINNSSLNGAAIYNYYNNEMFLQNTTVSDNYAVNPVSIYLQDNSNITVLNSILWNEGLDEMEFSEYGNPNSATISFSDIRSGMESKVTNNNVNMVEESGIINETPNFINQDELNYKLSADSPFINAGTAYYEYDGEVIVNFIEDEYYGLNPDIGAYEYDGLIAYLSVSDTLIYTGSELQFQDLSYGNPTTWQWDFENDDVIDSNEKNPLWSYSNAGIFDVSLTISDGLNELTAVKESFITVLQSDTGIVIDYLSYADSISGNWQTNNIITYDNSDLNLYIDAYNPDGNELAYYWLLNEDVVSISDICNISLWNDGIGEYVLTLNVTDNYSSRKSRNIIRDSRNSRDELSFSWNIQVLEALIPEFTVSDTSGSAPLNVQFTDLSSGDITSWQWDFDNDGTIDSTDPYPVWIYNEVGIYSVSLTISNDLRRESITELKENLIEVMELPAPYNLIAELDQDNGLVNLSWEFDSREYIVNKIDSQNIKQSKISKTSQRDFLQFYVYRNGVKIDSLSENSYIDTLNEYGIFEYEVTACHVEGESSPTEPVQVEWQSLTNHFIPVSSGNGYNQMTIIISSALIEEEALQAGDEIGIFDGDLCVGAGLIESSIPPSLSVAASADDPLTDEIDGFIDGNEILYRIWDNSLNGELDNISALYLSGEGIFNQLGTSMVEITYIQSIEQNIELISGWNMLSFNIEPDCVDINEIMLPLIDEGSLEKVQDETGMALVELPEIGWFNGIGDMIISEGYYINVNMDTQLALMGLPVELPIDIDLSAGWNIMSYPCINPQDAEFVLNDLISSETLMKVQNESGQVIVYLPGYGWFNNLGDFMPGEGYYINVNSNVILCINDIPARNSHINSQICKEDKPVNTRDGQFYEPVWDNNPYLPMNIFISEIIATDLEIEESDEIGVFDGGTCVGYGSISTTGIFEITASADDPITEELDGFLAGNLITMKYWDESENVEYYDIEILVTSGTADFVNLGSAIMQLNIINTNNTDEQIIASNKLYQNFPNPFNPETTINFSLKEECSAKIVIYDVKGKKIETLIEEFLESGTYSVIWNGIDKNGEPVASGIYFYQLETCKQKMCKKMIVLK